MRLLYISNGFTGNTVFESQVRRFLLYHKKKGCQIRLIALCNPQEYKEADNKDIGFPVRKVLRFPGGYFRNIGRLNALLLNDRSWFEWADIIMCRGILSGAFALNSTEDTEKVITDMRGITHDEIRHNKQYRFPAFYAYKCRQLEADILKYCAKVFFVSAPLKRHYVETFSLRPQKCHVFPTFVDNTIFRKDRDIRNRMRNSLGYSEEDFVYVYSGGTSYWQNLKQIFRHMNQVLSIPDIKFLILSKDVEYMRAMAGKFHIPEKSLIIKSVIHEKMPEYLNAADCGILIRKDDSISNLASPTKVKEYIACGLKVVDNVNELGNKEYNAASKFDYMSADDLIEEQQKIFRRMTV